MKIVCDSCGAKYSIADEKVQGKVFKIRCKKCSNVIVVKGTADEASAGGDLGAADEAAEWYVVIDGEQVGPVTTVEIDSYFMSGRIAADTYAWKDGMGDWKHIVEIPEFAHLGDSAGPTETTTIADAGHRFADEGETDTTNVMQSPLSLAEASDPTIGDSPAAMGFSDPYPSDPGYGDDEYGYAASSAEDDGGYAGFSGYDSGGGLAGLGGDLAAAGGDDDGGGMFAAFDTGGDSSDFMSFGDSGGAAEAPTNGSNGAPVGADMVGQRNENSVLFSLSSLDSVPAVGGDDKPITEGSGLIDIQALATAHKSMSDAGGDMGGGIDPFAQGTMAMPALMPMGSHRSNNGLYAGLALAGVAVFALIGIVIYMVASKEEPKAAAPTTVIREVITEKLIESPDKKKAEAEAAEAEKAALAAAAATKANKLEDVEPDKDKASGSARKKSSSRKKSTSKKSATENEDVAPKPKKKKDGIDSILDKIDEKGEAAKKKEPSSGSSKKALSRNDVKKTINRYGSRVNTCSKSQNKSGKKGTVKVKFFIRPNGRVRGATVVSSGFKGTDVGKCVQKVVGSMTFPKTSAAKDVPVTYPFILK